MEKKEFWLGMLALALVFGMMVAGCDNGTSNKGGNGAKSITITGITGKTGDSVIYVASGYGSIVAAGRGKISSGSVTFNMVKDEYMTPWTENGSFYLMLIFDQDQSQYYYTNGQTINISEEDDLTKLPKYNITSTTSTIAFNLFKERTSSIDDRPDLTGTVTINNTSPKVGDTLTATYSGGNGTGTITWQWIQGESTNIGINNNTYTITAADEGKTIKVQVSFSNQKGSKTSAATGFVTATQTDKPPAPSGLVAGAITENSITISWNSVNEVLGYTVYAGISSGNMTQRGTPTNTSFTITGLTANTTYYIAVSAKNASGEGVQSSPIITTTANTVTKLPAPSGLAANPIAASNTIQLSWNGVVGAASYKVYRSDSVTGTYTSIGTTLNALYNDVGITPGDNYYYKVSALTSGNVEGDISGYVAGRIPTTTKAIEKFGFVDFPLVNGTISGPNISVTVPNIVNLTTLVPTIKHNGKSISPAPDVALDFTSPKQYRVTADDGSFQDFTVTVTVTNTALATAFSWIYNNASFGRTYTIVAQASESLAPITIEAYSTNIILSGGTTEKTISLSSNGSLFTVSNGTLTLENNITLSGRNSNTASLVRLNSSGKLVMKTGSKIKNNTFIKNDGNAFGGGVYIGGGSFTMDGGTISDNKIQATGSSYDSSSVRVAGGGVYLYSGTFIMNNGTISNNTAYSDIFPTAGGGVYIAANRSFTMNGGTISGNTAQSSSIVRTSYTYGGGVAAWDDSTFTMKDGIISGNIVLSADNRLGGGVYVKSDKFTKTGGTIYGSDALTTLKNTAKDTSSGHAVYADLPTTKLKRNNTAGVTVNMDSSSTTVGWE